MRRRIREVNLRKWRVATSWSSMERTDWILQGATAGARKVDIMKGVVRLLFERGKEVRRYNGGGERLIKERAKRRKARDEKRFVKRATEQARAHIDAAILSGLMTFPATDIGAS